jgi:hypothetical protein
LRDGREPRRHGGRSGVRYRRRDEQKGEDEGGPNGGHRLSMGSRMQRAFSSTMPEWRRLCYGSPSTVVMPFGRGRRL